MKQNTNCEKNCEKTCLVESDYTATGVCSKSGALILSPVQNLPSRTQLPEALGGFLPGCQPRCLSELNMSQFHYNDSILSIRPINEKDCYGKEIVHLFRGQKDLEIYTLEQSADVCLNLPQDDQVLTFKDGCWINENLPVGGSSSLVVFSVSRLNFTGTTVLGESIFSGQSATFQEGTTSWDNLSGEFVAPVKGCYQFNIYLRLDDGTNLGGYIPYVSILNSPGTYRYPVALADHTVWFTIGQNQQSLLIRPLSTYTTIVKMEAGERFGITMNEQTSPTNILEATISGFLIKSL